MAVSLQVLKSAVSPFYSKSQPRELGWRSDSQVFRTQALGFRRRSAVGCGRDRLRVFCKIDEADGKGSGEERPESLFMKELKKRGITPTSLLEESNRSTLDEESQEKGRTKTIPDTGEDFNRNLTNQREQSMALNSEGLEGLVPRAKLLLTLGGTFFLAFWPLILVTVSAFAALYFYFGTSFIHDGSRDPVSPPQYIDPYVLLQEERISGMAPQVK